MLSATVALALLTVSGCAVPWTRPPGARLTDLPQATWARIAARGIEFPEELANPFWIVATATDSGDADAVTYRWRHTGMETFAAWQPEQQPDLRVALYDDDAAVAANAAIVLARDGHELAAGRLVDVVADESAKMQQRLAACETLGTVDYPWVAERLEALLADHASRSEIKGAAYNPQMHAELLRAAALHASQIEQRWFLAALNSRDPTVRLAAVQSWPMVGEEKNLGFVTQLIGDDSDRRVRAAAVLAAAHCGAGMEPVEPALTDSDLEVRLAAIKALGVMGGPRAVARLEELMKTVPNRTRGRIVCALTVAGETDRVLALAVDESWQVRLVVAEALGQAPIADRPHRQAVNVARGFLTDRSAQVQWATVDAVSRWPLESSGALLLTAMEKSGYRVRKAAADQLATLWEPARLFPGGRVPVDASQLRRDGVIRWLRDRWAAEYGLLDHQALASGTAGQRAGEVQVSQQRIEQVIRLIQRLENSGTSAARGETLESLAQFGADLPAALWQARLLGTNVPEVVYGEVLALHDPVFAVLDRLTSRDLAQRRSAAARLAELAGESPWPRLALVRLVEIVMTETDAVVWRGVLAAVAGQPGTESNLMAYTAIGHRTADVRRRACEHLAMHPDARHEAVLAPALADEQAEVATAAARALARQGSLSDPAPLERLLGARDPKVQLEAARALARHGHDSGRAALARMAHDADPAVRLRVAQIAGELGEGSLVAPLISMLDDRQGVRLAALAALPRVVGDDPTERAGDAPGTTERVARWKEWYDATNSQVPSLQ